MFGLVTLFIIKIYLKDNSD